MYTYCIAHTTQVSCCQSTTLKRVPSGQLQQFHTRHKQWKLSLRDVVHDVGLGGVENVTRKKNRSCSFCPVEMPLLVTEAYGETLENYFLSLESRLTTEYLEKFLDLQEEVVKETVRMRDLDAYVSQQKNLDEMGVDRVPWPDVNDLAWGDHRRQLVEIFWGVSKGMAAVHSVTRQFDVSTTTIVSLLLHCQQWVAITCLSTLKKKKSITKNVHLGV